MIPDTSELDRAAHSFVAAGCEIPVQKYRQIFSNLDNIPLTGSLRSRRLTLRAMDDHFSGQPALQGIHSNN
jgi:hypothetical protein